MIDFKLMDHQKKVLWDSQFKPDVFLAWEMGVGKSCATIQMLRYRYQQAGRILKTLILGPTAVQGNWAKEFGMFSKVPKSSIHVLTGAKAKRIGKIKSLKDYPGIIILNYEVMHDKEMTQALLEWGPEALVCDEAHMVKSITSKRAKSVALIADKCLYKYMLTGTPILNSPMDLFMPFRIMDGNRPDATFGNNFFAFRAKYFEDANARFAGRPQYFPDWQIRPSAYEAIHKKISKKMYRVTKEECLDLPDLVTVDYETSMSLEQERLYKTMKRDFVAFVKNKEGEKDSPIVARIALTKALRLQQIVTGFVQPEGEEPRSLKDVPRLQVLKDLLQEITPEHKVIVWAVFHENYDQIRKICDEIGVRYTELHGGVLTSDKFNNVEAFNEDPGIRVCIANQSSGGAGINLTAASYSIYYSRNFKLGDDLQSESRNHRRGSEVHSKITRINLVARGTIDEIIDQSIKNKQDISNRIMSIKEDL